MNTEIDTPTAYQKKAEQGKYVFVNVDVIWLMDDERCVCSICKSMISNGLYLIIDRK